MSTVALKPPVPATGSAGRLTRKKPSGGGIGRYLLTRFLLIIPTIFILVSMVFWLMRTTGDPITAALGGRLSADQLAERIAEAGYDRPIFVQYLEYLGQVFTGNFGTTISTNRPVSEILTTYGAATVELAFYALVVAFIVGIPLGMVAAYWRDKAPDAFLRVFAILCYATPVFFAGLLLKLVFAVWLKILPVSGRATTGSELQIELLPDKTGLYTIDALRTGDPAVFGDVLAHAVLP
ncbi:MAG: ABC transporter permease, partial [Cryobacterium sp.]